MAMAMAMAMGMGMGMGSRRILCFGRTTLVNAFRSQFHRSMSNCNTKIRPSIYKKFHQGRVLGDAGSFGLGCDFEHWQIWPRPLSAYPSKDDEIIRYYIDILSQVLGCKEQAIQKIYSVATRQYYAFGANVDEKIADKLHDLQNVCYVVPDSYLNPHEKRYRWDPFVNGQPLPYDPKYYPASAVPLTLGDKVLDRICQPGDEVSVVDDNDLKKPRMKKPRMYKGYEGFDLEHWQIYTEPLSGDPSKDEIIHYYVKIFSQVLGSEEEAVKKIYSVATRYCYVFGANISLEIADMIRDLPMVRFVIGDVYEDPIEKRYPWEPFINGQTLPYDPKYYPIQLRKQWTGRKH